jgi:hypothetical protein
MAYDGTLADRVRADLGSKTRVSELMMVDERRMMGGLVFMVRGHMCVGVIGPDLFVRVGPPALDDALALPHARSMDFVGKPSKNMVYVAPEGVASADDLHTWIERGLAFIRTLPPKA